MKTTLALVALAGITSIASADTTINASLVNSAPIGAPATFGDSENLSRYSNITNFVGQAYANGGAVGGLTKYVADNVTRTGVAGEALTEFTFSVSNFATAPVNARARVRFHAADGAGGGPGTYITGYSFNPISFASGVGTYNTGALAGGAAMPLNFWVGITFDNVGTNTLNADMNFLGQGIFDPATQGSSADGAWQTAASSVGNVTNPVGAAFNFGGAPVANFGWKINTAPTPGALALMGLGGLAAGRRRR